MRPGRHGRRQGRLSQPELAAHRAAGRAALDRPDGTQVTATAVPAPTEVAIPADRTEPARLSWDIELGPGSSTTIELSYAATTPAPPVVAAPTGPSRLAVPAIAAGDHRLAGFLDRSVADLIALELADPQAPEDHFLAAGAPWYLTLFGRDCLLAARMLLPLGTGLAGGTLRTLARRQGSRVDPDSAEEPGKILHEIRAAETEHHEGHQLGRPLRLPATYYGTVDATPLWILLLHDSWRWGLPEPEVEHLLPNLERALAWLADYGTDGNGFLSYVDRSGHGLSNQGWKDSADAVCFRDGRLAEPPVALCEVQAYGYAAALAGADLLAAFGRPGAQRWRQLGGRACRAVPAAVLAGRRAGRLPGAGAGRARPAGGLGRLEYGPPAGQRAADRSRNPAGRRPAGLAGAVRRLRAAHPGQLGGRVQPAELPQRFGVGHDTAIAITGLAP